MSVEFCANALKPLGHANDKKGFPCHYLTLTTKKEVLHAESNAISKLLFSYLDEKIKLKSI